MASMSQPGLFLAEEPAKDEKDTTCTICLSDTPEVPKVLPCSHIFCEGCLQEHLREDETSFLGSLTCPNCRAEHLLPAEGIEGFPTVAASEPISFSSIKKSASEPHTCGTCKEGDVAVGYCWKCVAYVCDFCVRVHKQVGDYSDHRVVLLNDISEDVLVPHKNLRNCKTHPTKEVLAYCDSCEVMICMDCIIGAHKAHSFQKIEDKDEKLLTSIKKLRESACRNLESIQCHQEYIEQVKDDFKTNTHLTKLCTRINDEYDAFVGMIEERREQLLGEARAYAELGRKAMLVQTDVIERDRAEIESALQFFGKAQECANVPTRIAINLQVEGRLKEAAGKKWKTDSIKPPLVFHCPDRGQLAQLGELVEPSKHHVVLDVTTDYPALGKEISAKVTFKIPLPGQPTCKVICNETLEKIDSIFWEDSEDGGWNLQFIPNATGVHCIQVYVCSVMIMSHEITISA